MNVLVLSTSLNPNSRSRKLARAAYDEALRLESVDVRWLDLRGLNMEFCDGRPGDAYNDDTRRIIRAVAEARGVLIALPVYNYSFSAAAKNVVEVAGEGFVGKRVGLLAAAGGQGSYMAPHMLAQSLILDFQTCVVPRYVYATKAHFDEQGEPVEAVRQRIGQLVRAVIT
ncbi:MAG: hypothetical protein AMXMBFR13_39250 [Phycisphaerae bacterium]